MSESSVPSDGPGAPDRSEGFEGSEPPVSPEPPASPGGAPRPRSRRLAVLVAVAVLGVVVAVGGWALSRHYYASLRVTSASMEPAYKPGASVTLRKQPGFHPHRGDLVMVTAAAWGMPDSYLKRVIGVGGDHVVLPTAGPLTVNGRTVPEPYVLGGVANGLTAVDVTVPAGRLFLLGDHRADSIDARTHLDAAAGTLPDSAVLGRVLPDNHALVPYFTASIAGGIVALVAVSKALTTWRRTRRARPSR